MVAPAEGGAAVIQADEQTNPDLLWMLRGAGNGNFGIVTSLTYAIHPLRQAIHVTATWPGLTDLAEVFTAWQGCAPHLDNRLTSQLEIYRDKVLLFGLLAGGSQDEARQILAPMLAVVSRGRHHRRRLGRHLRRPPDTDGTGVGELEVLSQFVSEPFPPDAIQLVGEFMAKAPTPECNYFTNAFGGPSRTANLRRLGLRPPQCPVLCRARRRLGHPGWDARLPPTHADTGVSGLDRGVRCGVEPLRGRRLRQRSQCRHGGLGKRLLGTERRPAAHDQGELRPDNVFTFRAGAPSPTDAASAGATPPSPMPAAVPNRPRPRLPAHR